MEAYSRLHLVLHPGLPIEEEKPQMSIVGTQGIEKKLINTNNLVFYKLLVLGISRSIRHQ